MIANKIPFNVPFLTGEEIKFISEAHNLGQLSGDGYFTSECSKILEEATGAPRVLLTHSCTAALEMAALLLELKPDDEVIMPSYTFVSTANAFVLRGATPVFVDIRLDTGNIDENLIEAAISTKTKAICVVHYAGISCEMGSIEKLASKYNIRLVEDAAQAIHSSYEGRPLGTIGDFGCYSFHETKNIISGEGGALIINDRRYIDRSEIVREKGTNRKKFTRREVAKYSWVDIGSSYLPGEIISAFLYPQLLHGHSITERRLRIWKMYHEALEPFEKIGRIRRPKIPGNCQHNGHMYYILLQNQEDRDHFIRYMAEQGISCTHHYVPLHSSKFGSVHSKKVGSLSNTEKFSETIVRLPIWIGLEVNFERIINSVQEYLTKNP